MGRVKKRSRGLFLFLAILIAVAGMAGCGTETDSPKEETVTVQPAEKAQKEEETEEEIPEELLPGQNTAGDDGTESSSVLDASDGGSSSAQGTNQGQTSSGTGTGTQSGGTGQAGQNSGQGTGQQESAWMQIAVSVESSSVGNMVSYSGTVSLSQGATAYDALNALCGGQITASGGYVTGIGGLSEKDYGSKSGWMYSVNGTYPNKASNGYVLQNGDTVIWSYVK